MAARGTESEPVLVDLSRVTLAQLSELPDTLFHQYLTRLLRFDGSTAGRRWNSDGCPEAEPHDS